MGPTSPEHGELAESAWKHDERLNNYKMATHTQVEDVQKSNVIDVFGLGFDEGWRSVSVAGSTNFVGYLTRLCKKV